MSEESKILSPTEIMRGLCNQRRNSDIRADDKELRELMESAFDSLRRERDDAVRFIRDAGYRPCDSPACNCGSWHGGHAMERLAEISDALPWANGPTVLERAQSVVMELSAARDDRDRFKGERNDAKKLIITQLQKITARNSQVDLLRIELKMEREKTERLTSDLAAAKERARITGELRDVWRRAHKQRCADLENTQVELAAAIEAQTELRKKLALEWEKDAVISERNSEIVALREQLRAATEAGKADKARLDWWFVNRNASLSPVSPKGEYAVWDQSNGLRVAGKGKTQRAAIDAAMQAAQPEPSGNSGEKS